MASLYYKIDRIKKTRKKTPRHKMTEHFYYDMSEIIERLQRGGGRSKMNVSSKGSRNKESSKLKETLISLGWNPDDVYHMFRNLTDKLLQNWPHSVFIQQLFGEMIDTQGWKHTIHESLVGIGMREDVAMNMEIILKPLLDSSYTHEQVLNIAIEYLLGKYEPTSQVHAQFLYHTDIIGEWSDIKIKENTYQMYNIPYYCTQPNGKKEIQKNLPFSNEFTYYYHATSWRSSTHIMDAIDRSHGRTCLDFGKRSGFYLATSLEDSIDWCNKNRFRWSNETCILIFRIPNELPHTVKQKHLEGDEWVAITKESRECNDKENEIRELRKYDLLYGNMVRNPNAVKQGTELPQPHSPPKQQLVGRTDSAEQFLQSCLLGCFYFQKHHT